MSAKDGCDPVVCRHDSVILEEQLYLSLPKQGKIKVKSE